MAMFRRAPLLSLALCSWLVACSEQSGGSGPAMTDGGDSLVDAAGAASALDASIADASQASSLRDAQADAGDAAIVGYPFLGRYLINARDLGGIPLPNGAHVASDRLIRGPLLETLPAAGCDAFAATGVRTVIDLRSASETASQPDAMCVREQAKIVLAPFPDPSSANAQEYIGLLDMGDSFSTFFTALADPSAYPIYFHCSWGRDRTGVAAALVLLVLGAARNDIVQDYLRSRQTGGVTADPINGTLDEIERRGGVEAYLSGIGVSADSLDALRHAVIEPLP